MTLHIQAEAANDFSALQYEQAGPDLCQHLIETRQLSGLVRQLNEDILSGSESARDRAIGLLSRLGLWTD